MAQDFRNNEGADWDDDHEGRAPMVIVFLAFGVWSALLGGGIVWWVLS